MKNTPQPVRLSEDMLPAIHANVLNRRTWYAIGILLLWGTWGIAQIMMGLYSPEFRTTGFELLNSFPLIFRIIFYGALAIDGCLISFAIYGMVTQNPKIIRMEGFSLIVIGIWNICIPIVEGIYFRMNDIEANVDSDLYIYGIIQIIWGIGELKNYSALATWLPEIEKVTPQQRQSVSLTLKAFLKQQEDYLESRIAAIVYDGIFGGNFGERKSYRGQFFDNSFVLISRQRDKCFFIQSEDAAVADYNKNATAKLMTDLGMRKVIFGPLSVIAVKRWAEVPVVANDIKRLVKKKKKLVSVALLREFSRFEEPELRIEALNALKIVRKDPDASAVAVELLDDPDSGVRATAMTVCKELRVEGLQQYALPMLKEEDSRLRASGGTYLSAFPTGEAAETLRLAIQNEHDNTARNQMKKALKSCEKITANPYAMS